MSLGRLRENLRRLVGATLTLAGLLLGPIPTAAQDEIPSPVEDATSSESPSEARADLLSLVQRYDRVLADMDEDIAVLREQTAFGGSADLIELLDSIEGMRSRLAAQREKVAAILEHLDGDPAQ
jgi:hypothetical protein